MTPHFFRPELHITADRGVLDAPAGVILDGETWHVFHQYHDQPQAEGQPAARWGHQISEGAPYGWEECDDVLAPQGEETTVRAGSVVAAAGGVDLYFTSVIGAGESQRTSIHVARIDDLAATTGSPRTEQRTGRPELEPGVRRIGEVVGDEHGAAAGLVNFRSPCVVEGWEAGPRRPDSHSGWVMLAVTGSMSAPQIAVLGSSDGRDWELVGRLEYQGDPGLAPDTVVVAPRLIRLRDEVDGEIRDILLVTVETDLGEVSGYLVGHLAGNRFEVLAPFAQLDFGYSFTRPRNTNLTPGTVDEADRYERSALFGLLNGFGRRDDTTAHQSFDAEGWANALSLPRMITLQGGRLFQTPAFGLIDEIPLTDRARSWTGLCEVPDDEDSAVELTLIDATGTTCAVVRHEGHHISVDRTMNPRHEYGIGGVRTAELTEGDTDSLTIITDGATLEVFADGGAVALASRVYFVGGCAEMRVTELGAARVLQSFTRSAQRGSAEEGLPEWAEDDLDAEFPAGGER